ncbi:methionine--tRNA ligase [candidate division KSB1 bacterium]|nr:methionine--tRNA ligase [candidate division KSB1 bacterium]NIR72046.1 methionine--tRNA ligase [candidate division KSB1 bacterium]NIS28072.1 methionine--tRNA ligase [candidate division KSB1 bacterium]NIT74958.1 methionine--tRNA ligase [candidate division KSB1 bacterium]NIU28742.1 methionine--tRNA ligase [candidate division KSB1 bacterium]
MSEKQKILVTSALPYANGPLHLGHLAGAYLPADIYVRYQRLKGNDVVYICGSDEHGVAITIRAEQEGVAPRHIIDRFHEINKRSFERFGMSFDNYSRTSLPMHHETAQEFFLDAYNKGILKKKKEKQFYDEEARMFLPDRYVEGTCPICNSPGARGDQCEQCGSDLNQTDLIEPKSKVTGKAPVLRETYHWYFPLGDFQERLKEYLNSHPDWKENVKNYCYGWIKQGLKDRAVTRDLQWGIKVPLEEAKDKVIYVWFEAVLGYISSTKEWAQKIGQPERWKDYWQDETCRLIHFIGKDNIVFHAIMFPAILMAKEGYALPDNVPANDFLNLEGGKFSTSRNYAVWLEEYLEKFPPDPLRFCLSAIAPETKDSDFSWKDFQTRNNSELVGILGNFVNRSLTFVEKHFENRVPEQKQSDDLDQWILKRISEAPEQVGKALDKFELRRSLKAFMDVCRDANKYFNDKEPWLTVRSDRERCGTTLNICIQISKALAILMAPFMPFTAEKLWQLLNLDGEVHKQNWSEAGSRFIEVGHRLNKPEILFSKIDDPVIEEQIEKLKNVAQSDTPEQREKEEALPETNLISIEDFKKVDLRVAKIIKAEKVEKADKLLRLDVEIGQEKRQIVAGIAEHYAPETLINKQIIVVANLSPAKIRGLESQGMLLAAQDDSGTLRLLTVDAEIGTGAKIS